MKSNSPKGVAAFAKGYNQNIFRGDPPPHFLEFYVPLRFIFHCSFIKKLTEIFKILFFMSFNFLSKIPQSLHNIFWNFFNCFKIEINYHYVPKLVQNHYIDQDLPKFSLITPKTANFSSNLHFSKLAVPSALKIWRFMSLKPRIFWSCPPFLDGGLPQKYSGYNLSCFTKTL